MSKPTSAVDIRGQISGIAGSSKSAIIMLRMQDGQSVDVRIHSKRDDIQPGAWVKCLAHSPSGADTLTVDAIIIDLSPGVVETQRINAPALVMPNQASTTPARGNSSQRTRPLTLPSRGGDEVLTRCKRAIAYFNPKLALNDIESIANNIVTYSNYVGINPYFVVAVVAAESRFNPSARSYKGAMGLGQLMPGTARGMGVTDAYDPAQNLAAAILILRRNLEKYKDQPNQQAALALAAYNAGPGAVKKHGGVPPYRETRNYIWKVYEYYCWMLGEQPKK